jgi:hypothetical protein
MVLIFDIAIETALEALFARFPGLGTNTALPYLGASRGMIRGMADTDATFAARLVKWIDRWRVAGSQAAIGQAIQDYCTGNPKVVVVNRAGVMTTIAANGGGSSVQTVTWNWDSLSNPERAGYWSEQWVIVYSPPWAISNAINTSSAGTVGLGLGTQSPRADVDAIRGLLDAWKSAHSYVRAVIWCYDSTLFNPANSTTMPDGTWGEWSYGAQARTVSGRGAKELTGQIRVWEPFVPPSITYAQAH